MALFLDSSILSKEAKSFGISSSFMPIPVSSTSMLIMTSSPSFLPSILKNTLPLCVYLTAFDKRFNTTCFIRMSSPYNLVGRFSFTSMTNSMPFSSAFTFVIFKISFNRLLSSYSAGTISNLPDSIFDESSISLIMLIRDFADDSTSTAYFLISSSLHSLIIISFIPMTALTGVLISWDILARNFDFATFALSDSFLSACISIRRFFSSVISMATMEKPCCLSLYIMSYTLT